MHGYLHHHNTYICHAHVLSTSKLVSLSLSLSLSKSLPFLSLQILCFSLIDLKLRSSELIHGSSSSSFTATETTAKGSRFHLNRLVSFFHSSQLIFLKVCIQVPFTTNQFLLSFSCQNHIGNKSFMQLQFHSFFFILQTLFPSLCQKDDGNRSLT